MHGVKKMIHINLDKLLSEKGMTLKELCEKIQARPSTVSCLYNQAAISIKLKLLEDICKELNCKIDDLISIE